MRLGFALPLEGVRGVVRCVAEGGSFEIGLVFERLGFLVGRVRAGSRSGLFWRSDDINRFGTIVLYKVLLLELVLRGFPKRPKCFSML